MKKILMVTLTLILTSLFVSANEIDDLRALDRDLSKAVENADALSSDKFDDTGVVVPGDPMRSLLETTGRERRRGTGTHFDGYHIQGIILSGGFKTVLCDDKFYREGDSIGPHRIVKIHADGVSIHDGHKTNFLSLHQTLSAPEPEPENDPLI